ncbi:MULTISPECIES: hypothetical protein [Bacillus]|uniref:hypothetical protein n=1 Tax=Bacillus TaxID=1386 RepID=UPI002DBF8407|nr:hypothetical protein [Bacillus halotolerans]MEC1599928.1 hypothetical protein [Bacillus halotolerans]
MGQLVTVRSFECLKDASITQRRQGGYKWFFLHFAGSAVMIEFGGLSEGELKSGIEERGKAWGIRQIKKITASTSCYLFV